MPYVLKDKCFEILFNSDNEYNIGKNERSILRMIAVEGSITKNMNRLAQLLEIHSPNVYRAIKNLLLAQLITEEEDKYKSDEIGYVELKNEH